MPAAKAKMMTKVPDKREQIPQLRLVWPSRRARMNAAALSPANSARPTTWWTAPLAVTPVARRIDTQEDVPVPATRRTLACHIRGQRLYDVGREWHLLMPVTFTPHKNHSVAPVDVVQSQPCDLPRTQPHSPQQHQHRLVPEPDWAIGR